MTEGVDPKMKRKSAFAVFQAAFLVLALAASSGTIMAQDGEGGEEGFSAYDVARLKIFQGAAWVRMPNTKEWEEFATNTPVPEKSRVSIPEGSEAELQFHGGQFVLLTGGTEIDIRRFDEELSSFRLRAGEIRFDLPKDDFSPARVAFPGGGIANFPVPGRYWLFVKDNGETRLVVRAGQALVKVGDEDLRIESGEVATIDGGVSVAQYRGPEDDRVEDLPPLTGEEAKVDAPPDAVRELSDYGEWVSSNEYGYVWRPMVSAGWSPYYYGRWVWIFPIGWTWVSYEPWGWYPYHFGWWANDPVFGWVWCPYRSFVSVNLTFGRMNVRHYHRGARFLPGNVRFVRENGNIRWIPLRPGERYTRSGIGRSDARIVAWDKPLARDSIFYRTGGTRGKAEWRDWSTVRKDRRTVVVGPSRDRGTAPAPRAVAPSRGRSTPSMQRPGTVGPGRETPRTERRTQPERKSGSGTPDARSAPAERRQETAPSERYERGGRQGGRTNPQAGGQRQESVKQEPAGNTREPESSGGVQRQESSRSVEKRESSGSGASTQRPKSPPSRSMERRERRTPSRSDTDKDR